MPFVKVDTRILTSSLWVERDLRSLFMTALVMAVPYEAEDPMPQLEVDSLEETGWCVPPGWYGFIPAAGTGIVRQDGLPMDEGLNLLRRLCAPDPDSRSQEFDGRRLARVNGGYVVLNFMKYRDFDYTAADRMRRLRARKKEESVTRNNAYVTPNVTHSREQSTESRVQSTESSKKKKQKTPARTAARGVENSADAFRLAPYLDAYQERFPGSSVPGGRFGKSLKALEAKHGADETLRRWVVFLEVKGELGPEYFARTWSEWESGNPDGDAALAWDGIVSAGLRMWRERTWTPEHHAQIDAGTKAGLSVIGGFLAINQADEIGRKSLRKQFIAAYRAASNGGK